MDADQNQRPADASITGGATQTTPENKKTAGEKEVYDRDLRFDNHIFYI
jgi:hypothetical protein